MAYRFCEDGVKLPVTIRTNADPTENRLASHVSFICLDVPSVLWIIFEVSKTKIHKKSPVPNQISTEYYCNCTW